jgi:hypothetical protein
VFDPFHDPHHNGASGLLPLGQEYLRTDSGQLISVKSAQHGGGSGVTSNVTASTGSPTSTLVGSSTGLQINLLWDSSVQQSANWSAVESAVATAAAIFTTTFTNHVVVNIAVGLGEIAGSAMSANALGESESYGYLTNYQTVETALAVKDAGMIASGQMASNALTALQSLRGESFFVTSAEAKGLGLVNGASTALDGYIGFTSSSILSFAGAVGSGQYDAVGVAAHEITEVMGRIGMEGQSLGSYRNVYTPLDIFRYSAARVPDIHPTAGYFSLNNGVTNLAPFNNPANGGDAADWATSNATRGNAFNAFDTPGLTTQVTPTDLLEVAALGWQLVPNQPLTTITA